MCFLDLLCWERNGAVLGYSFVQSLWRNSLLQYDIGTRGSSVFQKNMKKIKGRKFCQGLPGNLNSASSG